MSAVAPKPRAAKSRAPRSPARQTRAAARSVARLAAAQALYQREMEPLPTEVLLHQFHAHRLREPVEVDDEEVALSPADVSFFDDLVAGADARGQEIDALISAHLAAGWSLERLDRPLRAILRLGVYELVARADVPVGVVIGEYLDVAHAFYDRRETGFVNGLLDAVGKAVRPR
jgi:N utilization substance protein B